MIQEFIPYQQALELKKLGFDEPCFAYYDEEDNTGQIYEYANCSGNVTGDKACYNDDFLSVTNSQLDKYGAFCSKDEEGEESYERWTAPTYSQAFRFFREKYNLVHEISWSKYKGGVSFDYDVFSLVLPTDDELGDDDDIYIEKPMETYDSLAGKSFRDRDSDTFEEAELACLNKLIEIVKTNKL